MPHGFPPELTVERVIGRSHRADVLRALSKAPAGLQHRSIQYDVVRGSVASTIIHEFTRLGLITRRDELYFITPKGKEALAIYDRLRGLTDSSNGDGGARVR
jgi:predicted transcriptional regulator